MMTDSLLQLQVAITDLLSNKEERPSLQPLKQDSEHCNTDTRVAVPVDTLQGKH